MSDFDLPFGASSTLPDVIGLGVLTRVVDRDTVDDVLGKAGRHQTRVRLLPARVVVYLVLALCLFTSDGYDEVVRKLSNGLRGLRTLSGEWKIPTPSAISQAVEGETIHNMRFEISPGDLISALASIERFSRRVRSEAGLPEPRAYAAGHH